MLSVAERDYHLRQYDAPYRSTRILGQFIDNIRGGLDGPVLDVGCGAGANLHHLVGSGLLRGDASGLDADRELVAIARDRNPYLRFTVADFLDPLPRVDTALSIQVLSFIEDWRPALMRLLDAAPLLFVTSLFWDGVAAHVHATDTGHQGAHYNVIEAGDFERACAPRTVRWEPFVSDLGASGPRDRLSSYTAAGRDFSGPLHLPWRIAMVQ